MCRPRARPVLELIVRGAVPGRRGGNYAFSMAITSNGGTGARPRPTVYRPRPIRPASRARPIEIAEAITPLIFWKKELRPGSGGAGRTRGGLGQIIEIESGIGEPFELWPPSIVSTFRARPRRGQARRARRRGDQGRPN